MSVLAREPYQSPRKCQNLAAGALGLQGHAETDFSVSPVLMSFQQNSAFLSFWLKWGIAEGHSLSLYRSNSEWGISVSWVETTR